MTINNARTGAVNILAVMMFLTPALGVPGELVLQDTLKSALVSVATFMAAATWLWRSNHDGEEHALHGMLCLPLGLAAYAVGSMVWSHAYLAGVEAIRWLLLALLMWVTLNCVSIRNLPRLLAGLHMGLLAASAWIFLQFWFDVSIFPQFAAPASTFINRNFFAEYAVCALPYSVLWLALRNCSRWLWLQTLSLSIPIAAILMTGTRSALLALGLLVLAIGLALYRHWHALAAARWPRHCALAVGAGCMVSALALASLPTNNPKIFADGNGHTAIQRGLARTASALQPQEYAQGSFSIRVNMWKATWRMAVAEPWNGVGAGAWEVQLPLFQGSDNSIETDFYAHNEFLQLLAEYGVLAGGLFIAVLLAYLLVSAGKTWRLPSRPDTPEAALRALVLCSMGALLLVSNAGFPWRLATTGTLLAINLGLLAGSDRRLALPEMWAAHHWPLSPRARTAALTAIATGGLVALLLTVQSMRAERYIVGAIHLLNTSQALPAPMRPPYLQQAATSLRKGVEINPHYRKLTVLAADALVAQGAYTDGLWALESVAASRPNIPDVWANIFLLRYRQGDWAGANAALVQMDRLQPGARRTQVMHAWMKGAPTQAP